MNLNPEQQALHQKALGRARKYKECEWAIIEVLRDVEKTELYKALQCPTLFAYAVKFLDLDNSVAYAMIRAARISREIPRLEQSLKNQKLTVAKATRIFSTLNRQNADALITFAEKHSADEINNEVARVRKNMGLAENMRKVEVSDETYALIKRARSLTQKADIDETLKRVLNEHLDRHDPVRKAKRAQDRKSAKAQAAFCTYKNSKPNLPMDKRKPLTAEQKHEVFARDGGQCTHRDVKGQRCTGDRFLHIHHIKPISQGGTNDPANLTTLCSFHHDLAHQRTFPIEGQITWLSDVRIPYTVAR